MALDAAGNFVMPSVPAGTVHSATARQADIVAKAFVQMFLTGGGAAVVTLPGLDGAAIRTAIEAIHRAPIDWGRVAAAPWPPYFAQTPVAPITDSVPDYVKRAVGSRYHVILYQDASAIADVAISSNLTGVSLTADSSALALPPPSELVRIEGLPVTLSDSVALFPEAAVRDLASRTGAKVDRLPRLLAPWGNLGPVFSRWSIHTDRSLALIREDDGATVFTRDVLVGLGPGPSGISVIAWYVAADQQPSSEMWPYVRPSDGLRDSVALRFASDIPVRVARVRRQ